MATTCVTSAKTFLRPMLLSTVLDEYLSEREVSADYAKNLRRTLAKAASYGIKTVMQLDPAKVNNFLAEVPMSQNSRHNLRREFVTIWRAAYDRGLTDVYPTRVRRIPVKRRPVQAWSLDFLRTLLDAAEQDSTPISSRLPWLKRKHVLPCWLSLGYDSGLRFTDVLSCRRGDFRNHTVAVTAHKTGKVTVRRVSAYTEREVAGLLKRSPDGTLFKWAMPRRRAITMFRSFLDERQAPGSSRWLRRSGATYCERDRPGSAPRFLGHSNPTLAKISYIDESLLDLPAPPPPLRRG